MPNTIEPRPGPGIGPFVSLIRGETMSNNGEEVETASIPTLDEADYLSFHIVALTEPTEVVVRGEPTAESELIVLGEPAGTAGERSSYTAVDAGLGNEALLSLTELAAVHSEIVITNVILHEFILRKAASSTPPQAVIQPGNGAHGRGAEPRIRAAGRGCRDQG